MNDIPLIQRLRNGDPAAQKELVDLVVATVKAAVRVRRGRSQLQRIYDTEVVCQSILTDFFREYVKRRVEEATDGLENDDQLRALLVAMAKTRLHQYMRREYAEKRDMRRTRGLEEALGVASSAETDPAKLLEERDLLARVRPHFTPEEWLLWELKTEGRTWAEVGEFVGLAGHTAAVRWARAVARVTRELKEREETDGRAR